MDWFEKGKQVKCHTTALAADLFDKFCTADSLDSILIHFRQLCKTIQLQPKHFPKFISHLKNNLLSVQNQAFLGKYEEKAKAVPYLNATPCEGLRVVVVGGGPCGLRAAIEAQLLGAHVTVIEKRATFSRNNVLHLWPFVIVDLKALGAKTFYPKFCAGAIDHISITQLQLMLLKMALVVGVEFQEGIELMGLNEPVAEEGAGWRLNLSNPDHPLAQTDVDVVIGASGRGGGALVDGFQRKELRAKLAIAITANFVNHRTQAEARVGEISGVSSIYRQDTFDKLARTRGIDLENIVYYKDHTHYFVMTVKKQSLLWKGVLKENYTEAEDLCARENVDMDALLGFILEAVDYWTGSALPNLEFALNHRGEPDVALFDFTAMYQAQNACQVLERHERKLLVGLVGDSLLEPFWPTGTGIARGFLSALDSCWMMRSWARSVQGQRSPLEVLAERESIYRLLAQTTTDNLKKTHAQYSVDPSSRYCSWNPYLVSTAQVKCLYRTDAPPPDTENESCASATPKDMSAEKVAPPKKTTAQKMAPPKETVPPIETSTPKKTTTQKIVPPKETPPRKQVPPKKVMPQRQTRPRTPSPVADFNFLNGETMDDPESDFNVYQNGRDSSESPVWNSTCYVSSTTYARDQGQEDSERERAFNQLSRSLTLPSQIPGSPFAGLRHKSSLRSSRVQGFIEKLSQKKGVERSDSEGQFQSPYAQELNELRDKRGSEYAQERKMEAMARIRQLHERKQLVREDKKERTIRRLENPQLPTSSLTPPTQSARTSDEFFDPYKMRLYRKCVPSISERSEKLADKLFNTGLKKKTPKVPPGFWEEMGRAPCSSSNYNSTCLSKSNSDSSQSHSSNSEEDRVEVDFEEMRRQREEMKRQRKEEERKRLEEMEQVRREKARARFEEMEKLRKERERARLEEQAELKRAESILDELDEDAIEDLLNWSEDAL